MKIGIFYNIKNRYSFEDYDARHCDFLTASRVSLLKHKFESMGNSVSLFEICDQEGGSEIDIIVIKYI